MKRKEVVKFLRKISKLDVCEDSYFYLIRNKTAIIAYLEHCLRYNKCVGIKMLLQKFSKKFIEIVETFGWRDDFNDYVLFFRKAYEKGFLKKKHLKNLELISGL